jgi:hypothetical protein
MRTSILILLMLLLMALSFPVNAIDKDLLLHLSFDEEGKMAKDETGKTKGGTILGGVKWVEGKFGNALELDGKGGYVEIELTEELIFQKESSFTMDIWMKSEHATSNNKGIFGTYGPTKPTVHFGLYHLEDGGKSNMLFTVPGANVEDAQKDRVNDGEWHHLAGVRDRKAGVIKLYIDAKLIGETNDPGNDPDNGMGKIWLGNHLNRWWVVTLDEARIWNRALSETEISRLMESNIMAIIPTSDKLTATWSKIKAGSVD